MGSAKPETPDYKTQDIRPEECIVSGGGLEDWKSGVGVRYEYSPPDVNVRESDKERRSPGRLRERRLSGFAGEMSYLIAISGQQRRGRRRSLDGKLRESG